MKTFKKLGSLAIALALVLSTMLVSASATDFTVKNAVNTKTYTAYKVFNVTKSGDNYSYTIVDEANDFLDTVQAYTTGLTATQIGTSDTYNITVKAGFNAADFALMLKNDTSKPADAAEVVAAGGEAVLTGLADWPC